MKFKARSSYAAPHARAHLAKILSNIVDGHNSPGVPFMVNTGDDSYWCLDSNNDWKLQFEQDSEDIFQIRYRYNRGTPKVESLAPWICLKLHLQIVEEII